MLLLAEHDLADIHRVERVHVLDGIDRLDHRLVIKVLRKRQLYQDTVDILLPVEGSDEIEKLLLRGGCRQGVLLGTEAHQLAGFLLVVDIHT